MAQTKSVVAVFRSEHQAKQAVDQLRSHGFADNEISVIGKDHRRQSDHGGGMGGQSLSEGGAWGAGIGGAAGLLASAGALAIPGIGPILAMGPLAATLTGAAAGGLTGGLVDFGIPEGESRQLERKVKEGEFLTVIKTSRDANEAQRILQDCGGSDVKVNQAPTH
jgi:uncharacterized membrane protein